MIGWFVDRRLIVVLLGLVLLAVGLYISPFEPIHDSLPRDPIAVDAIPYIGENQQIVFTRWPGRSPQDVEDQVTYPLTTSLLGIAGVRTVRSTSAFGFSSIYIIFEDDVEFYWSRSRVLEKLASLPVQTLPDGVSPVLGPDATALGQIFWYTLEGQDESGRTVGGWDLEELRSIQDWTVRYALQAVPGVSEVASIGGFVREYQVDVDPNRLRAQGVTITQVADAIRSSNLDVGARTLEINRVEYIVRGIGLVEDIADLESTVIVARQNTPIRVRDVARVTQGPALRRGALDDEGAPAVGGVVVARFMENPRAVISALKQQIASIEPGLPVRILEDGTRSKVAIVPFYDRTELIEETLETLSNALFQQILVTIVVVMILLRDLRSSFLISAMLPLGVIVALSGMKLFGVDANIMALGGIAIAIGTMVDVAIVFVENIGRRVLHADESSSRLAAVKSAAAEVAPAVLTSVLTTVVSFLPVFGLSSAEFRLFAPLALTKTFAMLGVFLLAVIVLPTFALWLLPGPSQRLESQATDRRTWRLLFRVEHVRGWLLVAASAAICALDVGTALFVFLMGAYRVVRPLVSRSLAQKLAIVEATLTVTVVSVLLTWNWMPLGASQGIVLNVLFVAVPIAIVLGGFRWFEFIYPTLLAFLLRHKAAFLMAPTFTVGLGVVIGLGFDSVFGFLPRPLRDTSPVQTLAEAFPGLGREYMPAFDEGAFLYMPTTMPHASIGEVAQTLSELDAAIAAVPEVDRVVGKLGRVDSALDPAPISMIETLITYRPEYRTDSDGSRSRQWRDHIRSPDDIWHEIVAVAERPGLTSAPLLMPMNARLVMLQSGMRAPMGIKVRGPTLETIEAFGLELQRVLSTVPALRRETIFADRVVGKPYVEIKIDREAIGRYGLSVVDVQHTLQLALGGLPLTRTIEGRERYAVRVRYMGEQRNTIDALGDTLVATPDKQQIPLSSVAEIEYVRGPQTIRAEDTFLTSYVLFDKVHDIAEVEAVEQSKAAIRDAISSRDLEVPAGVAFEFAGSYTNQLRSEKRLMLLIPLALACVVALLYLQFRRVVVVSMIYVGVLVAVSGAFGLLWLYAQPWFLDFHVFTTSLRELFQVGTTNLSVAVWVGVIALVGVATDDGVLMATYLRQRFGEAPPTCPDEARIRTVEAGTRRVRPCLMTTATTILALLPVITSQGRGSDIMVALALPSLGGMAVELMTLFVVPVLYCAVEERRLRRETLTP
ncbi:MAG: efflux RND transporter permease subunit [Myxococcota bacterium]